MTKPLSFLPFLVALALTPAVGCDNDHKKQDAGGESDANGSSLDASGQEDAAIADASDAGALDAGASDAASSDAGASDATSEAGISDAGVSDSGTSDAGIPDAGGSDAGASDVGSSDAGSGDAGSADATAPDYRCPGTAAPSGWTLAEGYRGVEVFTDLREPVALTFAGDVYGSWVYIVNQGDNSIDRADLSTGTIEHFATLSDSAGSHLLTTITWDSHQDFDGALYVGDQGTNADQDSAIYRLTPQGSLVVFARAPGESRMPGLDDIFSLAFTPGSSADWPQGLLVTGDTDGEATPDDWGLYDSQGVGQSFSSLRGTEGLCVDTSGEYGGGMLASRPNGRGYSGDDSITRVLPDGTSDGQVATELPGVHAVVVAPTEAFGRLLYAASWSSNRIFSVDPEGATHDLATGLSLTEYDGNILAFSPDGQVLLVADRSRNRVVCIEPTR